MSDFEKEIFTEEELSSMNEKLKKQENTELPESLKPENIEKMLGNDPHAWVNDQMNEAKARKKRHTITFAASVAAILVVSLISSAIINHGRLMNYFLEKTSDQKELTTLLKDDIVDRDEESAVSDYEEIEKMFLEYADKYDRYYRDCVFEYDEEIFVEDGAVGGMGQDVNSNTSWVPESDKGEYGETNEQVQGVSEADIIKNDGEYLYVIDPDNADWSSFYDEMDANRNDPEAEIPRLQYNCSVSIIKADSDGNMNRVSQVFINEDAENIYHMFLDEIYVSGDKLVAIAEVKIYDDTDEDAYDNIYYGGYNTDSKTMAVCFDISDRSAPTEMWRIYQDGSYVSSRLINDQLVLLSEYGVNLSDDEEEIVEDCIPTVGYNADECERIACDCIVVMEQIYDTTYLVTSTLDIDGKDTLKTQAVLGAGDNVYCTTETLYATSNDYNVEYGDGGVIEIFGYDEIKTQIYKFDIRDYDIAYMGNTSVEGSALNQFSMDEHNGYLRIATTSGSWGDSLTNQLYILDENLQTVGKIEGIAKGESIRSVRFVGDTGYVVTFEQTDPLFVIDLSDPTNPVIKGELKIPGFSSYLHPVGDGLVIGVGYDGTENGTNGGMKISLFDVSDPENPVECDKYVVSVQNTSDNRWSYIYCEAWYSHKAICWDAINKTMYIPFNLNQSVYTGDRVINKYDGTILALKVDGENKSFVKAGEYSFTLSDYEWVQGFSRVTYIGNAIYALTSQPAEIYSFDKATAEYKNTIKLG